MHILVQFVLGRSSHSYRHRRTGTIRPGGKKGGGGGGAVSFLPEKITQCPNA